jgi:hypothetical protein
MPIWGPDPTPIDNLLLVLVLATACGRTDSAPIDADDHQTCLGYGFTPGTDGFVACKMRLQRSR